MCKLINKTLTSFNTGTQKLYELAVLSDYTNAVGGVHDWKVMAFCAIESTTQLILERN
jgi:hypothetical protein